MASLATYASLLLTLLKVLGTLAQYASDTRAANETDAAALGRVLADVDKTTKAASAARKAAHDRDAAPGGLQHPDGFQRDK